MRFDLVTARLKARPFKAKSLRALSRAFSAPPWLIFILIGCARQAKNDSVTKLNKVFPEMGRSVELWHRTHYAGRRPVGAPCFSRGSNASALREELQLNESGFSPGFPWSV